MLPIDLKLIRDGVIKSCFAVNACAPAHIYTLSYRKYSKKFPRLSESLNRVLKRFSFLKSLHVTRSEWREGAVAHHRRGHRKAPPTVASLRWELSDDSSAHEPWGCRRSWLAVDFPLTLALSRACFQLRQDRDMAPQSHLRTDPRSVGRLSSPWSRAN